MADNNQEAQVLPLMYLQSDYMLLEDWRYLIDAMFAGKATPAKGYESNQMLMAPYMDWSLPEFETLHFVLNELGLVRDSLAWARGVIRENVGEPLTTPALIEAKRRKFDMKVQQYTLQVRLSDAFLSTSMLGPGASQGYYFSRAVSSQRRFYFI